MSQWQNPNPFVQLRTPGYYNNVQNMSQQHQNNHFMGITRQHPNRQSTSTMYTYKHSLTQEPNYNRQSQTPTTNHINPYNMSQTRQHQEPDIWGGIDDAALINIDAEVQQSTQAHFNTVRIRELIPTNVINIPGNSVRTNNFNSLQNTNAEEDLWGGLTDEDLATIDSSIHNSVSTMQMAQVGNETATNPETRRNQVEKTRKIVRNPYKKILIRK